MISALPQMHIERVAESEWHNEYGDLILAVKIVDGLHEAMEHIPEVWLRAYRCDHNRRSCRRTDLPRSGRLVRCVPQCVDEIFGWLQVWIRCRSGDQYEQTARAWPGGTRRADHLQVRAARHGTSGARLSRPQCATLFAQTPRLMRHQSTRELTLNLCHTSAQCSQMADESELVSRS